MKDLIKIGIPSKGRLRKDVLKIFNKNKLKLVSESKRNLFGSVKGKPNIQIIYLHARQIIERLSDKSLDIGFSGLDLLKKAYQVVLLLKIQIYYLKQENYVKITYIFV